ncbi:hypothetical protein A0U40_17590 [[Bacillus] sp. KCTC 13219]|nr:hypothetical protein A0U40_17590 [[Bacillus] sp. KCTC 13219]
MSKLHLIHEIETTVRMVAAVEYDSVKLAHYLDDLLSNYRIEAKDSELINNDNSGYIEMFLNSLQIENYSEHTLKNYRYELKRFENYLSKNLLKATTADIRAYLAVHSHLKISTITTKIDTISSFYNWLIREEELLKNPCLKIKRPRTEKKVREGLTIIELEKVRAACKDERQRALIEAFYSTGCRLDELHKLNINDIDWQNGSVIVYGKGNKERRVYLSEKAKYYLKKYLDTRSDDCPALFTSQRKPIRRLTKEGIQYQIKKIRDTAKIEKPLHPHIMRHTFAQLALDNGIELADLQALMGHEKADTTARYAQVSDERKHTAFKKYHMQ